MTPACQRSSLGIPEPFRGLLTGQIPREPSEFLGSDLPFVSLSEAIICASIYPVLLQSAGMISPHNGRYDFATCSRAVHQNTASKQLARCFMARLVRRWSGAAGAELQPLRRRGLIDADIAEVLLYCAMTPYGWIPARASEKDNDWETEAQREKGCTILPSWVNNDQVLSACTGKRDPEEMKVVLKPLCPEQLHVVLSALQAAGNCTLDPRACRPYLRVADNDLRHWEAAACEQAHTRQWYGVNPAKREKSPARQTIDHPLEAALYKRIRRCRRGLELCFTEANRQRWYRVDMQTGRILRLSDHRVSGRFYLDLRQADTSSRPGRFRGRQDILLAFAREAMKHRPLSPVPVTRSLYRKLVMRFVAGHRELLMAKRSEEDAKAACSLSDRPRIAWEIYGIVRQFGPESRQFDNVKRFAAALPSLFRIIPKEFLRKNVVPGASLRKAIPYWTRFFAHAAQQQADDYRSARGNMMRAVLLGMGAHQDWIDGVRVTEILDRFGFRLPFEKQPRWKEAFILFLLRNGSQKQIPKASCFEFYEYIRQTKHMVSRQTTLRSLGTRCQHWFEEREKRQDLAGVGGNKPLPPPWLPGACTQLNRRIVYLRSPLSLWCHAREQENCVFGYNFYAPIAWGEKQIYRLENLQGTGLGTIEVKRDPQGRLQLGDRLGPQNQPLSAHDEEIIEQWFCRALAAADAVPTTLTTDCIPTAAEPSP